MQTLGLTMTTAATDAGADSAMQPNAAASSAGGAIFDILMSAAASGAEGPANSDITVTAASARATQIPETSQLVGNLPIEPATQALAADMEQMVQALAITADVVAKGMAARTTPVREIILKVEAPLAAHLPDASVPDLSAVAPANPQIPDLKISEADPATNIDPALLLLMPKPQASAVNQLNAHDMADAVPETAPSILADEDGGLISDVPVPPYILDMPVPQAVSDVEGEPNGPWRIEIYGPVLDSRREVISAPVYAAAQTSPEPDYALTDPENTIPVPAQKHTNQETSAPNGVTTSDAPAHEVDHLVIAESIRSLTISVPLLKPVAHTDTLSSADSDDVKFSSSPDDMTTDTVTITPDAVGIEKIMPQQPSLLVVAGIRLDQPPSTDQAVADASTDVLEAPRRIRTELPVVATPTGKSAQATAVPSSTIDEPHRFVSAEHQQAPDPSPAPLQAKVTLRQAELSARMESLIDTNVSNSVANSSSTSSANIRDLVKLGVRDIEIQQGNGIDQVKFVGPQVQTVQLDNSSISMRPQAAEAFASGNNETAATERRAQAHEIRMRAIERQVVAAVRDGSDTIRMQLYPPGLGQIIIRLSMDGSKIKMSTRASSEEAVESLRSIEGDLRDALSTGGLELAGFDVSEDGEQNNKRQERPDAAANANEKSRSAKSEDFALDMNA